MTLQQTDILIKELIDLALELGANKFYINKLLLGNGLSIQESIYRGFIKDNESESK